MIRLNIPTTDYHEMDEIAKVLSSGYLTQGPMTAEFERKVANFVGCRYSFATSSCTTALHLALVALEITSGDEVLVADFTFPATANVVVQQGAIPVLVDIDLDNFSINPDDLRRKITPRSKAIIPVHPFGCSADMQAIMEVASSFDLSVIEDAATAIGATYLDRFCGNIGTIGCFSFHPRKVITTGEGGMLITNDEYLSDRIRILRNHGGIRKGYWSEYIEAGFNYRLSDIQGALGVAQMEKLSNLLKSRVELANNLRNRLLDTPGILLPFQPAWGGHIYQSFVIRVDSGVDRDRIIQRLRENGVEATIGTYALHAQPFFQTMYGYRTGQLSNSYLAFTHTITLPLYPQMTEDDLDTVATQTRLAIENELLRS